MSNVWLATKTIDAINANLEADQGASYRGNLKECLNTLEDAYRSTREGFRSHLGASIIGNECTRSLWYNFRWAVKSNFEGRMVRLFNRGHLEEARFMALLKAIGCQVTQFDSNGKQFRISFAEGHAGGSGDGFAIGIPDLPEGTWALTEFKTHGDSSFKKLQLQGVKKSKYTHYVQVNLYMAKFGLQHSLYLAVNKNTDELYGEIIPYDHTTAEDYLKRGDSVVWSAYPPVRLANSPGFYACKYCDYKKVCFEIDQPNKNCRTCSFSKPIENGEWICIAYNGMPKIPKEIQEKGCDKYEKLLNF